VKVLWVNSNFMHPTTKGGQIRTLEMLKYLHRWHEIHYVALENPDQPEGPQRAPEYSAKAYPFRHQVHDKRSAAFAGELLQGLFARVPLAVSRFHPAGMRGFLEDLIRRERFDAAVMDHLAPTAYFPDRAHAVLFQHNVEFMIWRRHAENADGALRRTYFKMQADRMFQYERQVCRESGHVVACSELDRRTFSESFGISHVSTVPTGVNIDYFKPPAAPANSTSRPDLVFVGSMDWLPNEQGVIWFAREILPLIRRKRPNASFAVVGRTPPASIQALAQEPGIIVTGTVPDVRPWFWESAVSVVPLRVGGGTRLKIYEAMAAKTAIVSTTIGAEGLEYQHSENIRIADAPADFAAHCLDLIENPAERQRMTTCAWELVNQRFSWEVAARAFDHILEKAPRPNA
jgi:glycosyltransferase involved in cell wall biosynthesis